jgi:deoxyribodipyrimidine photolyase-related protein
MTSNSCFVILPIHLFDISILEQTLKNINKNNNEITTIYITEEPVYFGHRSNNKNEMLNFNKLKLIYHHATLNYYCSFFKKSRAKNNENIKIINLNYSTLCKTSGYSQIKSHSRIYMYNPVDTFLEAKYAKLFGNKLQYIESPLFLCNSSDLESYHNSKPKATRDRSNYSHASFYKWQRERLNILSTSKTYDTENRNMMPLDTTVPPLPKNDSSDPIIRSYLLEAISYVEKVFPDNLQPFHEPPKPITPESIHFPITHKTSALWLDNFCKNRFAEFGKYEDSIDSKGRNFLFHSTISPMLNLGLLTPMQVVNTITKYYEKHKDAIGISNYEGFIRQVIGWREYQRYIYVYAGEVMRKSNHFDNSRKLCKCWYNATTGIKPVDDAIRMAINDGYIHHILRLMVVGNFMNLVGIHPDDVYKWFMEFSLDSYDWVMIGNVYSMTLWADGGMTMRKPYISGSGYIMKMGNYPFKKRINQKSIKNSDDEKEKKEGKDNNELSWQDKWDVIFHNFIDRNSEKLSRTYYNGVVKAWERKGKAEKDKEIKISDEIIQSITE